MSEYEDLEYDLQLTPEFQSEEQLQTLKRWCRTNVSQDIVFTGSASEKYHQYHELAKAFLDYFKPRVPGNIEQLVDDFEQQTAIQYAATKGYDRFIHSLKMLTPMVFDQPNQNSMTPLHLAALKGHVHTVDALLKQGANPKITNKNKQTPLFSALQLSIRDKNDKKMHSKKEHVFHLLWSNAPDSVMHQDTSGDSVFHLMASNGFADLLSQTLEKAPEGIALRNNHTRFPIHTAILNNQLSVAKHLLEHASDIANDQTDSQGRAPLHYAAMYGSDDLVELCISATKDINKRDTLDQTPLILAAAAHNQTAAVHILIHHGADESLTDCNNRTYHDYEINNKYSY